MKAKQKIVSLQEVTKDYVWTENDVLLRSLSSTFSSNVAFLEILTSSASY